MHLIPMPYPNPYAPRVQCCQIREVTVDDKRILPLSDGGQMSILSNSESIFSNNASLFSSISSTCGGGSRIEVIRQLLPYMDIAFRPPAVWWKPRSLHSPATPLRETRMLSQRDGATPSSSQCPGRKFRDASRLRSLLLATPREGCRLLLTVCPKGREKKAG